jgi:uncharacterized protein YjbI with pentapeptide repeats
LDGCGIFASRLKIMGSVRNVIAGVVLIACAAASVSSVDMRQNRFGPDARMDFKNGLLDQAVFGSKTALEDSIVGIQDVVFKSPKPKKKPHARQARPIEALWVGAELGTANFEGASLVQASLIRADLREANFTDADLTQASLHGADLRKANFTGAKLNQTHLESADLSEAVGLTQGQLDLAMANDQTKLPAGLRRPGRGAGD